MNHIVQLISLGYSFWFGVLFYFLNQLNTKLKSHQTILDFMVSLMFVVVGALLYITGLYQINKGVFHLYFLGMILLGYIGVEQVRNLMTNNVKLREKFQKVKLPWYNKLKK